ncbi:MAG TPA: sugar transferase [Candidatus Angelobacter sp.]|nr:sugar transferase [Candidatus Angelobacter sp.]
MKRILDVFGSLMLITLLGPLMMFIALALLLDQGMPLIYRRRVVGCNGEFDAYKFRSMRKDADRVLQLDSQMRLAFEENFKLKSDPRITRLGSFLRKYSLDELPQLFNVLFGEMSLVGPRMITEPELEKYGDGKNLLLSVKPGLTGYWQVYGRQEVSYAQRVQMDIDYIAGWRFGWDLKILLLTPYRVIRGRGAY